MNGEIAARQFNQLLQEIKEGNFALLDEVHHFLAGFKSLFTDWAFQTIEESRLSCGGAGFLSSSGFTEAHDFYSPQQTFEGDNTVMMQQSSRYLFKLIKRVRKGKTLDAPFEYLNQIDSFLPSRPVCRARTAEDFLDLMVLEEALRAKTLFIVRTVSTAYADSTKPEKTKANDLFGHQVNEMAR